MAVESPQPLQQHVHRAQVGEQHVEVHVQALLHGLGSDDDPGIVRSALAEPVFQGLVQHTPVIAGKAGVVQRYDVVAAEQVERSGPREGFQGELDFHSAGHRIAQHEHAGPGPHLRERLARNGLRIGKKGRPVNRDGPATGAGQRLRLRWPLSLLVNQQGVGLLGSVG